MKTKEERFPNFQEEKEKKIQDEKKEKLVVYKSLVTIKLKIKS